MTFSWGSGLAAAAALVLAGGSGLALAAAPPSAAKYVAMGSSFAAGPMVTMPADNPSTRCSRSLDNYPHQLARKRDYRLTDVSCSGATTAHLLSAWNELPAQLDAVTPDTALVTITIGGNDVRFSAGLAAVTCKQAGRADCPKLPPLTEDGWTKLEGAYHQVVAEVKRRAPKARIVLVEYPVILPPQGLCAATPIALSDADALRAVATRLAALTSSVARAEKVDVIATSVLSKGHDVCAPDRWAEGAWLGAGPPTYAAYHPNFAGHTAVAGALDRLLGK
jgi:lysophospholipase L1-like esterase